jgi:hypothetical protein
MTARAHFLTPDARGVFLVAYRLVIGATNVSAFTEQR